MSTPRDPFTLVLPVRNLGDRAGSYLAKWADGAAKLGRDFTLLIVDDGSTDGTSTAAETFATSRPNIQLLRHETSQGNGACLRTALPHATHPLFAYATADYPYEPADLRKLLDAYGTKDEYTEFTVKVVNGCRSGRPAPAGWAFLGRLTRGFCKYILGNPVEPYPGWLGAQNHAYAWFAWLALGDPFIDPHSGFKLFDRRLFERFPVQSNGDFVHTEIVAKSTFLTTLMTEVPLTPKPDPIPAVTFGKDLGRVYRHPKFTHPEPTPIPPPVEPVPPLAPA
jgi:glycosyltransferase involved in cell wall biosynthesis